MNPPVTRIRLRRRTRSIGTLGMTALLLSLFLLLGFTLQEPFVNVFDQGVTDVLRGLHNEPLHAAARVFDLLGSSVGFAVVTLLIAGFLLIARHGYETMLILSASAGAWLLNTAAKQFFARPRPELEALVTADGFSYPSGNATIAAALFGTAAVIFAREARSFWAKGIIVVVTVFLVLAVGLFRIYAGVHYPTDIIGGYLLGASYLAVLIGLLGSRR
jgi:undecaprenyl-diphosphatase